MSVSINGTSGLVFNDASTQNTAATGFGFKNRILNGGMVIDQRNAGASVTVNGTSNFYACDRFSATGQPTDGVFTIQQSTTAPAGFSNALLATVTTADASIGASQYYVPVRQKIEGLNVADFGWGTANASTVTLSFWVRCSVTGTFGGAITNSAQNRSYPFSYTINAANTYEQKTITIAGDTSGTWLTSNGTGLDIIWSIGMGSSLSGTAGTWAAAAYLSATGATNLISTIGATFYITGVQLEKGSTATSFDYRPYGAELALCQRYYEVAYGNAATFGYGLSTTYISTANSTLVWPFKVQKRASPTFALGASATWSTTPSTIAPSVTNVFFVNNGQFYPGCADGAVSLTASSEL